MKKSIFCQIPSGIWVLGIVSMLMDISSEMIHSLLPVFMVKVLGSSVLAIGLLEGVGESTALIIRLFSGVLSDYLKKRKSIVLFGYALSACTKPMFALAQSIGFVFFARFLDRMGKGIRGAPRDALIADLAPVSMRGASFGLRQSLDTIGAVLGPLLAFVLMLYYLDQFRLIFILSVIPALLAVVLILLGIKDPELSPDKKQAKPFNLKSLSKLPLVFWIVCLIGLVMTLARFSEAFLVLRALENGWSVAYVPLVLVAMNIVYSLMAYPFGRLADNVPSSYLLLLGLLVLIGSNIVLARSSTWSSVLWGVCLWGAHMGITQGLLAAMVANTAPDTLRGSAFGVFYMLSGIAMLFASLIAGFLWDNLGSQGTFYTSAAFSSLSFLLLLVWTLS